MFVVVRVVLVVGRDGKTGGGGGGLVVANGWLVVRKLCLIDNYQETVKRGKA